MARGDHPISCRRCGTLIQAEDMFCGGCGANVTPGNRDAGNTQEVASPSYASGYAPVRSTDNRRALKWAIAVGVLLFLLAGTGALAYATLSPGINFLGWSNSQSSDTEGNGTSQQVGQASTDSEATTTTSVSADAPPDPAFDKLLPELERRTENVNLLLPAKLPSVLKNVAVDRHLEGDSYGVAFFREPPKNIVEYWGRASAYGTLKAAPKDESSSSEYFEATSVETIQLPDGAEATLRRMEPIRDRGTQGPFWEGRFNEGGYIYTLTLFDDTSREMATQVLSTIVEVPRQRGHETTTQRVPAKVSASKADAEEAAKDYYLKAGSKDWEYTYDNLDSQTRSGFTREEWSQKNQWFADNGKAIYNIESVNLDESSQKPLAEVAVRLTGEDGSSSIRNTYFVFEDGSWKHRFGQEEKDLFMPDFSYEEFVEANQ